MMKLSVVMMIAGLASGWWIQGVRWDRDVASIKLQDEQARRKLAENHEVIIQKVLKGQQAAEARAAELDRHYSDKLNDEQQKNVALAASVAAGNQRMRVTGTCRAISTSSATSARGMGNASSVELSGSAGQNVLTVRSGILADRQKIEYLQHYIAQVCQR